MEKKIEIILTEREIEALQISISAASLGLQEEIDSLKEHNKTGINTKKIKLKAERIQELDALFYKLYTAEKLMQ